MLRLISDLILKFTRQAQSRLAIVSESLPEAPAIKARTRGIWAKAHSADVCHRQRVGTLGAMNRWFVLGKGYPTRVSPMVYDPYEAACQRLCTSTDLLQADTIWDCEPPPRGTIDEQKDFWNEFNHTCRHSAIADSKSSKQKQSGSWWIKPGSSERNSTSGEFCKISASVPPKPGRSTAEVFLEMVKAETNPDLTSAPDDSSTPADVLEMLRTTPEHSHAPVSVDYEQIVGDNRLAEIFDTAPILSFETPVDKRDELRLPCETPVEKRPAGTFVRPAS